ncbi:MAG: large conductance mechanosensitive channel protein MscL, partial [Candidatus Promineifilaceae bacterium]
MLSDFRKFIMRGNVIDLAIGVVLGTAFTAIVNSLVNDIIMPIIAGLMGDESFANLSFQVGEATVSYGLFIQAIVNFLIISLVIFLVIRYMIKFSERLGADASGLKGIVPDSDEEKEPEPEP